MIMKKSVLSIIVAILMAFAMCFTTSAITGDYIYEFEHATVFFNEDTTLNEQVRQTVAEQLVYGKDSSTTYGLWCTLFGHSYELHAATKITHCVYDTEPRCLEEIYEVQVCSRCEDTVTELIGSAYITCCPEE